ncbi:MAG: tetratricopeptide repeat protein [Bacteroidia bacterium]
MKKKLFITMLFFNAYCLVAFSQSDKVVDSLYNQYNLSQIDTNKVSILNHIIARCLAINNNHLANKYIALAIKKNQSMLLSPNRQDTFHYKKMLASAYNFKGRVLMNTGDYQNAIKEYQIALKLRQEIDDKKGVANALNNIGLIHYKQGNYEKALSFHKQALDVRKSIDDEFGIAMSLHNIGVVSLERGDYEQALKNILASIEIKEKIGDKQGIIMSLNNVGIIYEKQGDTLAALANYEKYLKISIEGGDLLSTAYAYNNIANIYQYKKDFKKAREYHLNSLKIKEKIGDKAGVAMTYGNLGSVFFDENKIEEALKYYLQSLKICNEVGDTLLMINIHHNIANSYLKQQQIDKAYQNALTCLQYAQKLGSKPGLKSAYSSLYEIYEAQGDYKKAFDYYQLFANIKDSLLNEQSSKQIAEMNVRYESEKKDKELLKKDAELNKQKIDGQRKKLQRNAFIVGFLLILILAIFVFRSYRQKKSANLLLQEKNQLIEIQKQLVEDKNLKITDSINYAQRIQQATLPSQDLIKKAFPQSFILFLPRDIVSGDFYWYTELPKNKGHLIVVGDCTGHGVPGAFMSIIGNTLLNEIVNVKGIYTPADILTELNKGVVALLNQSGDDSDTQDDGMDVTVVLYNPLTNEVDYAAANHISYLYSKNKLVQLQGDIYSIGGMFGRTDLVFNSKHLKLDKGDMLYLFTDGYADQFGGEKNEKYTTTRFEQLFVEIKSLDTDTQKQQLTHTFETWKGINKQLDDVLVMGIKI